MNSNMTRKQKEALAAVFINQAGDLVEFFAEIAKENAALAGVSSDQVSRQLSVWLNRLPGDAWDMRLQGYVNTPAVDEPEEIDLGPLETISPIQERILRSGSPLNGMTALSLTNATDVHALDSLVRHGYLWADENGRTLLDTRGYEWLRENPEQSAVKVVDANQEITPTMEKILRSAVPLNGMITFIPSDSVGSAELNELIDTQFLWEDSEGDVFLSTRGNEWLRENPTLVHTMGEFLIPECGATTGMSSPVADHVTCPACNTLMQV